MTSIFIRWSVYRAFFGPPPPIADCEVESDQRDGETASTNRFRLSSSTIKQALRPERDSQYVDELQSELLHVQALVAAEQSKVDEKEILLERAHADLRRLEIKQREEAQKLHRLLQQIREAEEKLGDLRAVSPIEVDDAIGAGSPAPESLVVPEVVVPEVVVPELVVPELVVPDDVVVPGAQVVPADAEDHAMVGKRATQFDFINNQHTDGRAVADVAAERRRVVKKRVTQFDFAEASKTQGRAPNRRNRFEKLKKNGTWAPIVDVEAEEGAVKEAAQKLGREGLLLFDLDGNKLTSGTCFQQLTNRGEDCIRVKTAPAKKLHRG